MGIKRQVADLIGRVFDKRNSAAVAVSPLHQKGLLPLADGLVVADGIRSQDQLFHNGFIHMGGSIELWHGGKSDPDLDIARGHRFCHSFGRQRNCCPIKSCLFQGFDANVHDVARGWSILIRASHGRKFHTPYFLESAERGSIAEMAVTIV
jgi:hypothetical protein